MMLSDVCLSDVCRVHPVGGRRVRLAGWRILADRARLGRPGSRLPLRASVAGLGRGISWRLPAYILLHKIYSCDGARHNLSQKFPQVNRSSHCSNCQI